MEHMLETNKVELCGALAQKPVYSHTSRDVEFFTFPLEVARLSGNTDLINILVRRAQLETLEAGEGLLKISGELRSFNNRSGVGNRLVITVLAREIAFGGGEDCNRVYLRGVLCKKPNLRVTPMGRDICDLMLAVNRRYGRSDYLPCIAWGMRAREAALWDVGETVALEGRIQSRRYIKTADGVSEEKTAFEVSVTEIERSALVGEE